MTEREKIDLKREGYAARLRESFDDPGDINARAARKFPYPKVTRDRILTLSGGGLRSVRDGVVYYAQNRGSTSEFCRERLTWHPSSMTAQDALDLAALVLNPTEEVDDVR